MYTLYYTWTDYLKYTICWAELFKKFLTKLENNSMTVWVHKKDIWPTNHLVGPYFITSRPGIAIIAIQWQAHKTLSFSLFPDWSSMKVNQPFNKISPKVQQQDIQNRRYPVGYESIRLYRGGDWTKSMLYRLLQRTLRYYDSWCKPVYTTSQKG